MFLFFLMVTRNTNLNHCFERYGLQRKIKISMFLFFFKGLHETLITLERQTTYRVGI